MILFKGTKKKLKEERLERQRLEYELAEQQRRERHELEQLELLHQQQMEATILQLENTQLAQQRLEKEEETRQLIELEKRAIKENRLRREARQRAEKQRKIKQASPETLRGFRELIREKYRLDVEIWGLRGARKPDRYIVEQKMEKADAVAKEIMAIVGAWGDNRDQSWDPAEWDRVQDICSRLKKGGIRIWADKPLWNDPRQSIGYRREVGLSQRESNVYPC
jgi:hypothetical protein